MVWRDAMPEDTPPIEPDLNFLSRFLHQGQYLEFRLKAEDAEELSDRFFLTDLAEAPRKIRDENLHVWFGVANRRSPEAGDATGLGYVHFTYVDMDHVTVEEALQRIVLGADLPKPTFLVNSGHGVHAYWELDRPLDLSDEKNRNLYKACEQALVAATGSDERATDPTRVLRVPGTWNPKPPPAFCRTAKRGLETYPINMFDPRTGVDRLIWVWRHTKVHELALGIAGWCYHKGISQEDAEDLMSQVVSAANDPEIGDRLRCVRDAYEGGARGKEIAYKPHLNSPIGKMVLQALEEIWGRRPEGGPLIEKVQSKEYFQPTSSGVDHIRRILRGTDETWIRTHVLSVPLKYTAAFEVEDTFAVNVQFRDRMGDVNEVTDFAQLPSFLRARGVVMSQRHLEDALGALRSYHINNGILIQKTRPAVGCYYEEGRLRLYVDEAIPLTTPQEIMKEAVMKAQAGMNKAALETYVGVLRFFSKMEAMPVMGLAAIAPLLYVLKEQNLVDMTPYIFLRGPHGLGKTTLNGIFTSNFYGTLRITGDAFGGKGTQFRVDDYMNSTTLPIHVEEAEDITFDDQAPKLKAAAESDFLSSKGKPSREQDVYLARSTIFFDGNLFPVEDWNLIVRFIVILMDEKLRAERESKEQEFRTTFARLEPIGIAFIQHILDWLNDSAQVGGTTPIAILRNTIEGYRKAFGGLNYPDSRRATVWAIIYTGLRFWEKVCKDHGIDFSITENEFIQNVITPLEGTLIEERPPLVGQRFRQWWVNKLVDSTRIMRREGVDTRITPGEGEYFVQDDDYWYITQDALERFREGQYRLIDIARALVEAYGLDMEAYYHRGTMREMADGKNHRVLRLPKSPYPEEGSIESFGKQETFTDQIQQVQRVMEYMNSKKGEWVDPKEVIQATGIPNSTSWLAHLSNQGRLEALHGEFRVSSPTQEDAPMEAETQLPEPFRRAEQIRKSDPKRPREFLVRDLMEEFNLSREEAEGIVRPLFDEGEGEE